MCAHYFPTILTSRTFPIKKKKAEWPTNQENKNIVFKKNLWFIWKLTEITGEKTARQWLKKQRAFHDIGSKMKEKGKWKDC